MSFLLLLVILRIVLMDFAIFAFIKTLVAIFGHAIQPLKHRTLSLSHQSGMPPRVDSVNSSSILWLLHGHNIILFFTSI